MAFEKEAAIEKLRVIEAKQAALSHASGLLYCDGVTVAPEDSVEGRARTMGVLSEMEYELAASPETQRLLDELEEHADELDEQTRREVKVLRRETGKIIKIPVEEYMQYSMLTSEASNVWIKAKNDNDFALFAPYLEKLIAANRRMASLWNPEEEPYNVLLDSFEEGLTMTACDGFFTTVRKGIVPLIEKIKQVRRPHEEFALRSYPLDGQEKLAHALMELEGIDPKRCVLGTTEHPFTSGFNNRDLRITTHYHEKSFLSSIYSVLHEGGHAIYEMNGDDRFNYTCLYGGASMSMHESQSRFYENIIGRSKAFSAPLLKTCREVFPKQLADVTDEQFYREINYSEPSLIRTEADELTYSLHVMVRYEIEKQLIGGSLAVADVPAVWNDLYEEYLGIRPETNREGCLQDSHWSGGAFGYFPSYALGSAYGAQMVLKMEEQVPTVWESVAKGDISPVTAWLKEHIHQYSALYPPMELLERVCGKFDPSCYIRYLTGKFSALYDL